MSEVMPKLFESKLSIFTVFDPLRSNHWPDVKSDDRFQVGLKMGYRLFFRGTLALLVHELERLKLKTVEMVENREYFTFDHLWWPDLSPDHKNDEGTFWVILVELSNAACRMSLRSSGAELDGGA